MTAVIVGLGFIVLGIFGFVHWFVEVLAVLKGFGSLSLIVGGLVAVIAGLSSFRPSRPNAPKE